MYLSLQMHSLNAKLCLRGKSAFDMQCRLQRFEIRCVHSFLDLKEIRESKICVWIRKRNIENLILACCQIWAKWGAFPTGILSEFFLSELRILQDFWQNFLSICTWFLKFLVNEIDFELDFWNWFFVYLFRTGFLQATQAVKIKFEIDKKSSSKINFLN